MNVIDVTSSSAQSVTERRPSPCDNEYDGGNAGGGKSDADKDPNNVAGGLKATTKNPNGSDEARQSAQERLHNM
ncbi:MAG: hypothetical protein M1817_001075 [Caeruleum heppii]|nr:MAG: hypothetical protein M1817_001075 [Caeruleum heppii]